MNEWDKFPLAGQQGGQNQWDQFPLASPQNSALPEIPDQRALIDASYGPVDRFLIGAGRELTQLGQGAKQLGLSAGEALGLVDDGTADQYLADIQQEGKDYKAGSLDDTMAANVGEFVGAVAPAMVPFGGQGALATRFVGNAAMGALEEGVKAPDEGETRVGNATKGAVGAGVGGEVFRAGAKGAGWLGRGVAKWFKGRERMAAEVLESLPPEYAQRYLELKDAGLNPTADMVTGEFSDRQFANQLRSDSGKYGDEFREREIANNRAFVQKIDAMIDAHGSKAKSEFDAGNRVVDTITKGKETAHAATDKAYKAAQAAAPDGVIDLQGTIGAISKLSEEVADDASLRRVAGRIGRLAEKPEPKPDFPAILGPDGLPVNPPEDVPSTILSKEAVEAVRQQIGKLERGADVQTQRALRLIKNQLDDDVEQALGTDVLKSARRVASENEFGVFDNRKVPGQILQGKMQPDDVVSRVISKTIKRADLVELVDTLEKSNKQGLADLRAGVMMHIKEKAFDGSKMNVADERIVSGGNLKRAIKSIGRAKLEVVFGKKDTDQLIQLASMMHKITNRPPGSISTANTAETITSIVRAAQRIRAIPVASTVIEPWLQGREARAFESRAKGILDPLRGLVQERIPIEQKMFERVGRGVGADAVIDGSAAMGF